MADKISEPRIPYKIKDFDEESEILIKSLSKGSDQKKLDGIY